MPHVHITYDTSHLLKYLPRICIDCGCDHHNKWVLCLAPFHRVNEHGQAWQKRCMREQSRPARSLFVPSREQRALFILHVHVTGQAVMSTEMPRASRPPRPYVGNICHVDAPHVEACRHTSPLPNEELGPFSLVAKSLGYADVIDMLARSTLSTQTKFVRCLTYMSMLVRSPPMQQRAVHHAA